MRIQLQIYEIGRSNPFRNKVLISFHHRLMEIRAPEIPSVHEKILVAETFPCKIRPADITVELHHGCLGLYVEHLIRHTCPEQILYPEFQGHGRLQDIDILTVGSQRETYVRPCQSHTGKFRDDMFQLHIVRLQEFPSRRNIIEYVPHCKIGTLRCSNRLRRTVYGIGKTDFTAHLIL